MTARLHLARFAVLSLCCCFTGGLVKGETLLRELKRRSVDEGLALVQIRGEPMMVLQPAGELNTEPNPRGRAWAWLSNGGAAVAWNIEYWLAKRPWPCETLLIVETPASNDSWRLPGVVIDRVAGVSPNGKSVAFFGTYKPPGSGSLNTAKNQMKWITGLMYASNDAVVNVVFQSPTQIQHPEYDVASISWSPDNRAFAYDYQGSVHIYDVLSKTSRVIASGSNPDWSPDGRWIAFRSPEGLASAINPITLRVRDLFGHREILWGVHWSPDSRYVMLTEQVGLFSSLLHFRGLFVKGVMLFLRIGDGASVPIEWVFDPGIDDRGFYWVTGYRNFLRRAAVKPLVKGCE